MSIDENELRADGYFLWRQQDNPSLGPSSRANGLKPLRRVILGSARRPCGWFATRSIGGMDVGTSGAATGGSARTPVKRGAQIRPGADGEVAAPAPQPQQRPEERRDESRRHGGPGQRGHTVNPSPLPLGRVDTWPGLNAFARGQSEHGTDTRPLPGRLKSSSTRPGAPGRPDTSNARRARGSRRRE